MDRVKKAWRVPGPVVESQTWRSRFIQGPEVADLIFVLVTVLAFAVLTVVSSSGPTPVNAENAVGLVAAVLLTVFLVLALLFPERF